MDKMLVSNEWYIVHMGIYLVSLVGTAVEKRTEEMDGDDLKLVYDV